MRFVAPFAVLLCAALWPLAAAGAPAAAHSDRVEPRVPGEAFGPVIEIESIEIRGNVSTAERLILRVLTVAPGDVIRAGDERLAESRFKVLALGFFRDVELSLRRGTRRGRVTLVVEVTERGTVVLNRLYFGSTAITPWWGGVDMSEQNLLGTGLGVGGAVVFAGEGDAEGASSQRALQGRIADRSILGSRVGAHGSAHYIDASEPYRVSGPQDSSNTDHFRAFDYRRVGGVGGASVGITPLSVLRIDGRVESVRADLPDAPTRIAEDGALEPVRLHLRRGRSRVATSAVSFDRDTRPDPVLPYTGDRLRLHGELGASWLGGDYDFGTAFGSYERWWPVTSVHHVISIHLSGGVVLGDAPLFDRLYVGDLNRMLAPRAAGLVVSTTPSVDLFGTGMEGVRYGEVGGVFEVQYSRRLFRGRKTIYGGDVFFGAGIWTLADSRDLQIRDESLYRALPIDLLLDAGLRLDTEVGIFELTIANGLGRLPL